MELQFSHYQHSTVYFSRWLYSFQPPVKLLLLADHLHYQRKVASVDADIYLHDFATLTAFKNLNLETFALSVFIIIKQVVNQGYWP